MNDFYNRYRNLFTNNHTQHQQHKNINFNKPIITQPTVNAYQPYFSVPQHERKHSNYLNVGRSPAMDQFQRQVLPKFARPYPEQHFMRLKTQMDQNTLKMNSRIKKNSNIGHQFYQLPRVHTKMAESPIRQRIKTEGGQYQKKSRIEPYDRRNMLKNIQQLQKQYLGRANPNEEDRTIDRNEVESTKLQNSRQRVMPTNQPPQALSRMQRIKYGNNIKKWQIKVLPTIESRIKPDNSVITPRENEANNVEFKLHQSRQKYLFGLRQNQYAFVNDKLSDIKKAQKYYPRGYINSYRQALLHRKNTKNQLQQRRMKLKMLLYHQDEKSSRI